MLGDGGDEVGGAEDLEVALLLPILYSPVPILLPVNLHIYQSIPGSGSEPPRDRNRGGIWQFHSRRHPDNRRGRRRREIARKNEQGHTPINNFQMRIGLLEAYFFPQEKGLDTSLFGLD